MKFILENSSVIIFFICYKLSNHNMTFATSAIIISSISFTVIGYFFNYKPSIMGYISTGLLCVMGILSIVTGDPRFIKMKPTIINAIFAITLLGGCYNGKGLMQHVFNGAIQMSEANWIKFSVRFGIYFAILAISNEVVWRNFSEDTWVNFKLFGMLPISLLFMFTQIPFLLRNKVIPVE
jgi:intracellular septation protein